MKQLSDPRSRRLPIAAGIGLIVLGLLAFLWWQRASQPAAPANETAAHAGAPAAADAMPADEPAGDVPLPATEGAPAVADTEPLANPLEQVSGLSADPIWAELLSGEGWLDLVVASVDALADGEAPRWAVPTLRPEEPFAVFRDGDQLKIQPSSYARYDRATELIVSLDPARCATVYEKLLPALQASYLQLGREEPRFENRLRRAIAGLRETPTLDADPLLVDRPFRYDFADPRLQASTDAQKQILRLGPANVARVRDWLQRFSDALDARGL